MATIEAPAIPDAGISGTGLNPADLETLVEIERRVLWLSTMMVHHANNVRPSSEKTKVGGHQASSASVVTILTALYFHFLRAGDRVSIIAFRSVIKGDRSVSVPDLVNPLTDDRTSLRSALDRVGTGNGTPYYDALREIADNVFRGSPREEFRGRRALVALTDGVDSASLSGFDSAKEALSDRGV